MRVFGNIIIILMLGHNVMAEDEQCVESYSELENKFKQQDKNIEVLQNTFYPVNQATPSYVLISYYYNNTNTCPEADLLKVNLKYEDLDIKYNDLSTVERKLCNWVWTDSAVYVAYSPWKLNSYALLIETFFASLGYDSKASLEIDALCNGNFSYQHLQKLTSRLKLISGGKYKLVSGQTTPGFAFQLLSIRNVKMVNDGANMALKVFSGTMRNTIRYGIALSALMLAIVINKTARRYKHPVKRKAEHTKLFYAIIWATAIVSFLFNVTVISITIALVIIPLHTAAEVGINISYLVVMLSVEFVTAAYVCRNIKDFPTPKILTCWSKCLRKIVPTLGLWSMLVSLQLLLFHGVFIFIVFINHPFGSLCMVMVYAMTLYCLAAVLAAGIIVGIILETLLRCKPVNKQLVMSILYLIAAIAIGIVLLCIFILTAGFAFVDGSINPFNMTAIANPIIASVTLGTMGWIAKKMVVRYWLHSESDETFVVI